MAWRNLDVLDAAERAADMINELLDRPGQQRLLHASQLRAAAQSIVANIAEGFGRGTDGDRRRSLVIARGETAEAIRHLGSNFRSKRIGPKDHWPRHNLLVVIAKMLNSLLNS